MSLELLDYPGVNSAGVAIRNDRKVMLVTVDDITADAVSVIPESFDGYPVVVEERERGEPHFIDPGGPITVLGSGGTRGFVMTDGTDIFLTGNAHVLVDSGTLGFFPDNPQDEFATATVKGVVPLNDGTTLDFGWIRSHVPLEPSVKGIGNVQSGWKGASFLQPVIKSGDRTGVTQGRVTQPSASVELTNGVRYTDIAVANYHADGGDSGSPVLARTGEPYAPLGLHFGGNDQLSYFCKLSNVESETGLTVVSDYDAQVLQCGTNGGSVGPGLELGIKADVWTTSTEGSHTASFYVDGVKFDEVSFDAIGDATRVRSRLIPHGELLGEGIQGPVPVEINVD